MDPSDEVRSTTEWVMSQAKHVSINESAIHDIAKKKWEWEAPPSWDLENWHYADQSSHLTAQYCFVLDALNFCFWPVPDLEYICLAKALTKIAKERPEELSGESLATISVERLQSWFHPLELPQWEERVRHLQTMGCMLVKRFEGEAWNMLSCAKQSAQGLVRLILENFPGFRDHAVYRGRLVHFYKRAQILVGDLWAAYKPSIEEDPGHPAAFKDISSLTMFADYRVPQLLEALGVLEYSDELKRIIDEKTEVPVGSEMEIEIRAGTVQAVERLVPVLNREGKHAWCSAEVDWMLWQDGEKIKEDIRPHHRTLTVFY